MFILPKKSLQRGVVELFLLLGVASTAVAAGTALYKTLRYGTVNPIDKPETLNIHNPSLQLKTLTFISPTKAPVQAGVVECGYPYSSANARTNIKSDESSVLRGFAPNIAGPGDILKVWYNDEHASILGIREIQVKTSAGTQTYPFEVSTMQSSPGSAIDPKVGPTAQTGELAGTDSVDRPVFPSLFITDITTDPNNKSGDWQAGGSPLPPHAVFGSWKSAVKIINKTGSSVKSTFVVQPNPKSNGWNMGPGTDPPPPGMKNEGYGTEAQWRVDKLVADGHMLSGHTYRVQFIVHDGDQTKTGGDVGEKCATVRL